MKKIIVWKKLEEQKQKQRDIIKSEYQAALSSIQKLKMLGMPCSWIYQQKELN